MSGSLLVVDDDRAHLSMLQTVLTGWGYQVTGVTDGGEAVSAVRDHPFDGVLMDVRMARVSGIEALGEIKAYNPAIPVIIMTAYSSVDTAVEAMKRGAYDYLTKPLNFDDLRLTLERALEHMALARENRSLRAQLSADALPATIIGTSKILRDLLDTALTVAATEATVLITGESGTGKELIARTIHGGSPRRDGPLITLNCAALTETLLESELFGHEKGAFTGADRRRDGRFMQAAGGTLFLDEVGEIPLPMQAKLLRAIQEREIQRLGSDQVLTVDVRIIAATNRDLLADVQDGRFREDLYYRLNVINLRLPALRERSEDVPLLARHFLERFTTKNRKLVKGFTPAAMDVLVRYPWPGNVRELENTVERAVIMAVGDYLTERELPTNIIARVRGAAGAEPSPGTMAGLSLEDIERAAIAQTLRETGWNKSEAAKLLQITRTTLHNKIRKYALRESGTGGQ